MNTCSALLLGLALASIHSLAQAEPAPQAVSRPSNMIDLMQHDPDHAAMLIAAGTFHYGCMERLKTAPSAAEFATGSDQIYKVVSAQTPQVTRLPFSIAGPNGDTCRITYQGAYVDEIWALMAPVFDPIKNPGRACTVTTSNATRKTLACWASVNEPASTIQAERDGDHFVAFATWRGPRVTR